MPNLDPILALSRIKAGLVVNKILIIGFAWIFWGWGVGLAVLAVSIICVSMLTKAFYDDTMQELTKHTGSTCDCPNCTRRRENERASNGD